MNAKYADGFGPRRIAGAPAKLSRQQIEEIAYRLRLFRDNRPCVLAQEYGCSVTLIGNISRGYAPKKAR